MAWSTPPTFVTGTTLTAANLNVLGGDLNVLGSAWTDDTATRASTAIWTTTGASIGNGTLVSRYRLTGKTLDWFVKILFGSTTSAGSTQFTFAYPGGVAPLNTGAPVLVRYLDSSVPSTFMGMGALTASTVNLLNVSSAAGLMATTNSTAPMTWATSDECEFQLRVEVA